ncbi:carbamoyltransferase HypF [Candidatus Bipolaricaulota bacterium]
MVRERRRLRVQGVVQGVGFRPFVYRTAVGLGLAGSVRNLGDAGVEIFGEGTAKALDALIAALEEKAPPLARVASVDVETCDPTGETAFVIASSKPGGAGHGSIPPDTSLCASCIADIRAETRFRGYWATTCTDCGPRFTVIEELPYDRPQTSMRDFPMCEACAREYRDPIDRRYHAQTIACPMCGPRLTFDGAEGDPIGRAVDALASGKIVAIKGIGGTHIACDATAEETVSSLRERLGRPGQPFALMTTEEAVDRLAFVDTAERDLLRSPQRPIVVLRKRERSLPEGIAPGLHTVGIMLPYTGLHVLLFDRLKAPLVMTSANLPGRPMLIGNAEILERLAGIADHFLVHDRRILARCDDSVRRRAGAKTVFLRRSRGYVPESIHVDLGKERILALGPETDLAFSLYADGEVKMSQHIGSVDDLETYEFMNSAVAHLKRLTAFGIPEIVACDLHPQFLTTTLAAEIGREAGARVVPVQHHIAHLASVMGEHALDSAVGIVLDGYGYGLDGSAWGGEVFVASDRRVERAGSLSRVRLPGGDAAAREPLRVAAALLREAEWPEDEASKELRSRGVSLSTTETLFAQMRQGVNVPWTTSAGRFLDAVSAWLGICTTRTYEGEPAMRLEATAARGVPIDVGIGIERRGGLRRVDTVGLFSALVELARSRSVEDVAATAQAALADGTARLAVEVAQEREIDAIALTGGVAYNDAIASRVRRRVEEAGLRYVTNECVPCGDGGVSFGQAVFAGQKWGLTEADRTDAAPGQEQGKPNESQT